MKRVPTFFVAMIVLATAMGGCASSGVVMRIDGTSQESTSKTLQRMSDALPGPDRCLLQAAILRIQLGDASAWKGTDTQNERANPLGTMIDGMTFQNILDLSERYPDKAGNSCKP